MKKIAKNQVVKILSKKVKRLYAKHSFKTIVVAGSIGKTSTKFAVASVLKQKYRVRYQEGNYNDIVSVPLIFFGLPMPSLFNPAAWLKLFSQINKQIKADYPYDIVILEVGTDEPGQIEKFKDFIQADLSIITAIAPEHMEHFVDLDAVAAEELMVAKFSKLLIFNQDLCDPKYTQTLSGQHFGYGINNQAGYQVVNQKLDKDAYQFDVLKGGQPFMQVSHTENSESQQYNLVAAIAAGDIFGLKPEEINKGLQTIHPVSGRMQRLVGANESTIIDDTYNASPVAVKGALDTLYKMAAPQKIVILGSMNELGKYSAQSHTEIGEYCDPKNITLLATVGTDANTYLAPAAQKKGVNVKTFNSPYEAGNFIRPLIHKGTVILAKGSQNGVFAEEAVKILLANPDDSSKLVRQEEKWQKVKQKQFGKQQRA